MAIVTVAELREYMSGVSLTASQQKAAQIVIEGTQEELETYLGRPVQFVQVREKLRSDGSGDLTFSVAPVQKIISLRMLGQATGPSLTTDITPLSEAEAERVVDRMSLQNIIIPGGAYVGRAFSWYIVEYVGGYSGYADKALKLAIMEVASRTMTVNHDDVISIKDDFAREPNNEARIQKGWRDEELKRFDRLRRRTVYR